MKHASDFRAQARDALRGNWSTAVLTGFVASLIGARIATGGTRNTSSSSSSSSAGDLFSGLTTGEPSALLLSALVIGLVVLVVWVIVTIVIGGAGKLGYATFNLKLVDHKEASLSDLFSQFHRLGVGFLMNLLMGLYTVLWSLLFVIPGIIKSFSYAMAPYILAEHPGMGANAAITESRRLMNGNKWRLFCLSISFIGWALLCAAPTLVLASMAMTAAMNNGTLGSLLFLILSGVPTFIGMLFLQPYQEAAYAAFYRDITEVSQPAYGFPIEDFSATSSDAE